ncbi:heme oxygenase-like protein [Dacryopinax primogenitus]|uniref:Heme oxygenase-like protein n=1 Tax=Dacryopinax primogenitus (strain DJM 731) TaxID=1858805 RepID=M5G3G4_DACPD|nr:heme oxygenase-like protein [Dacryopinax primogenitus]EJT98302.1 heme oxygenase-like protein [Dacryopinax primogenitus]
MPASLTSHLLTTFSPSYERATRHAFLKAAGERTLDKETLSAWLTQDYIYTRGYLKLVGLILSRYTEAPLDVRRQLVKLLSTGLNNVSEEQAFFLSQAEEHGLDIRTVPAGVKAILSGEVRPYMLPLPDTAAYVDFMIATGTQGTIEEALVLLWATCYLEAWTFASQCSPAETPGPAAAALDKFIHNWSHPEFRQFVDELGEVVDQLGVTVDRNDSSCEKAEGVMYRVLHLEEMFWPKM